MDNIINFFVSNYVTIAIVLILILMAVIGYYAEKTNFGTKSLDESDVNKVQNSINPEIGLNDVLQPNLQQNIGTNNYQNQSIMENINLDSQINTPKFNSAKQVSNQNINNYTPVQNAESVEQIQPQIKDEFQNSNNIYASNESTIIDKEKSAADENIIGNTIGNSDIDEEFSRIISNNNTRKSEFEKLIEEINIDSMNMDVEKKPKKSINLNIELPKIKDITKEETWKF